MTRKNAFTLVELVVVISILAILSTVAVMNYTSYMYDARDSSRLADAGIIKSNLRAHKQKKGAYPLPSSFFVITHSGSTVAKQGILDDTVGIADTIHVPQDPRVSRYYGYSTTSNQQAYQIAMTLEKQNKSQAYVDGDYKTVAKNILPSLFLAMTGSANVEIGSGSLPGAENRKKFILNGSTTNLLYDMKNMMTSQNLLVNGTGGFIFPITVDFLTNTSFLSCTEIAEAGKSIGAGEYQVRSSDGASVTNTGCTGTGFSF